MLRPALILLPALFSQINAQGHSCCATKVVGGITYEVAGRDGNAYSLGCTNDCTYYREGDYSKVFCFKPGQLEAMCSANTTGYGGYGMTTPSGGNGGGSGGSGSGCRCGVKKSSRIVGGTEVSPVNKYPWMAAIMNGDATAQFCGGTLVASKYVITAAHCMFSSNDESSPITTADVSVRLGDHNLAASGETTIPEKTVKVANIYNHENYKPSTGSLNNDITVLELAEEVDLNVYTPACMAQTSDTETFYGKDAWVYGWGTTSSGGSSSSTLLEVSLPVVTKATCETAMGPMEDGQICAGGQEGKDSCQGDSGGPLTYESSGQHILIGDVSYGDGCAKAGKYGVYGRISFYRTWIEGKMSSPSFCPNGGANAAA